MLALDSSPTQTNGARARTRATNKVKAKLAPVDNKQCSHKTLNFDALELSTVVHKTVWIGSDDDGNPGSGTAETLAGVIDEWVTTLRQSTHSEAREDDVAPILFVALHACGSLTPNILRSMVAYRRPRGKHRWFVASSVIVGCCYNLLESKGKRRGFVCLTLATPHSCLDFPLSSAFKSAVSCASDKRRGKTSAFLSVSHLQLAAQVPGGRSSQDDESVASFSLALRKVVYRALLQAHLERDHNKCRLGKLNNKAYVDFRTFLHAAAEKMHLKLDACSRPGDDLSLEHSAWTRRIEVLHTLRCLLGPLIETVIIQDRYFWMKDTLALEMPQSPSPTCCGMWDEKLDVQLVNMFNQRLGSGRNVAVVVAPEAILRL